jgi:hypothetical protein
MRRSLTTPPTATAAAQFWSIDNNLSLGNMDYQEFADAADDDGVFRGL